MSTNIGRLTAHLADSIEVVSPDLIGLINTNISPPDKVEKDDVYIRLMYVVSDQVNSFGGCFPIDEHERLCELLIDSPVMVGHRKDHLPIGRNFFAERVEKEGQQWVKCYFYWLKKADGAETLRENIDGGIYKECSIGFTFLFPECSVCGKDIRICQHEPFEEYDNSGDKTTCYFNYRQIEKVLETSLVYRGAVTDTSISKDLRVDTFKSSTNKSKKYFKEKEIDSPLDLDPSHRYLVTPYYEGMVVELNHRNELLTINDIEGKKLPDNIISQFDKEKIPELEKVFGILIGYRGKERCPLIDLQKYINSKSSPVTRLVLKLFPNKRIKLSNNVDSRFSITNLKHCYADIVGINLTARSIMTREGVRIWPENESQPELIYKYFPEKETITVANNIGYYSLSVSNTTGDAIFSVGNNRGIERFLIRQFNLSRLLKGGRFIADRLGRVDAVGLLNSQIIQCGKVTEYKKLNEAMIMELSGSLQGDLIIQPIKIDEQNRWLFYQNNYEGQIDA